MDPALSLCGCAADFEAKLAAVVNEYAPDLQSGISQAVESIGSELADEVVGVVPVVLPGGPVPV